DVRVSHIADPLVLSLDKETGHQPILDELAQELGCLFAARIRRPVNPSHLVELRRYQEQRDSRPIFKQQRVGVEDLGLPHDPLPPRFSAAVVDGAFPPLAHELRLFFPRLCFLTVLGRHVCGERNQDDQQNSWCVTHKVLAGYRTILLKAWPTVASSTL